MIEDFLEFNVFANATQFAANTKLTSDMSDDLLTQQTAYSWAKESNVEQYADNFDDVSWIDDTPC